MKTSQLIGVAAIEILLIILIIGILFPIRTPPPNYAYPIFTIEKITVINENTLDVELIFKGWSKEGYGALEENEVSIAIERKGGKTSERFPAEKTDVGEVIVVRVSKPNWQLIKGEKVKVKIVHVPTCILSQSSEVVLS